MAVTRDCTIKRQWISNYCCPVHRKRHSWDQYCHNKVIIEKYDNENDDCSTIKKLFGWDTLGESNATWSHKFWRNWIELKMEYGNNIRKVGKFNAIHSLVHNRKFQLKAKKLKTRNCNWSNWVLWSKKPRFKSAFFKQKK